MARLLLNSGDYKIILFMGRLKMNKSAYKNTALTLLLLLASTASALAGVITADFPSTSSTNTAAAGQYYYNTTHTVKETFSGAGVIDYATGLDFSLLIDNRLATGAFVNFDVFLNSNLVGNFTISQADGNGPLAYSFTFSNMLANDYEVMLAVTNNVAPGSGSVNFIEGSSSVAISGGVPSPGPLALIGLGLLIAGIRKKSVAATR